MIKYDNKNWFSFLFIIKGTMYRGMFISTLTMGLITYILCELHVRFGILNFPINSATTIGSISLVVGMLLVFRMNTAYDRWWEGRKLLGQLMNSSRFLAMKIDVYLEDSVLKDKLENLIASYSYAMAEHLQGGEAFAKTLNYLTDENKVLFKESKHKPSFILSCLSKEFYDLNKNKIITNEQLMTLEGCILSFTDIVGGCERIKNTPIPFAYAIHLKRIILLYCLLLPFTIVGGMGYWSILAVMLVFFVLVGIEIIGEEIEDPFGNDHNDLPILETAENIRKNIEYLISSTLN